MELAWPINPNGEDGSVAVSRSTDQLMSVIGPTLPDVVNAISGGL
jgi:hypothetical protein